MKKRSTTGAAPSPFHTTRRRRAAAILASTALAVGMLTTPGFADMPHEHALLLHVELEPFSYGKCVDLAGGRALRTNTHHETLHTGRAGAALHRAGHLVVPYTCAQLKDALGE
jgi:hypothetical protein